MHYLFSAGDEKKLELVCTLAETPGEANTLWNCDVFALYDFAKSVFNSIATVSGANSFKIADRLSMKDDDGKWDIQMFLKIFSHLCIDAVVNHELDESDLNDLVKYGKGCSIASKYIQQLRIVGINKQFLVDSWILEMRREWM